MNATPKKLIRIIPIILFSLMFIIYAVGFLFRIYHHKSHFLVELHSPLLLQHNLYQALQETDSIWTWNKFNALLKKYGKRKKYITTVFHPCTNSIMRKKNFIHSQIQYKAKLILCINTNIHFKTGNSLSLTNQQYMNKEMERYIVNILYHTGYKNIKCHANPNYISAESNSFVISLNISPNDFNRTDYNNYITEAICTGLYSICAGFILKPEYKSFNVALPLGKRAVFK